MQAAKLSLVKNVFVCCLPTQNFRAESVGRKKFFFAPDDKITVFKANIAIKKEPKNIFLRNDQKSFWIGGKIVGQLVNIKPNIF